MCGIVGMHSGSKSGFYSPDKDQLRQMLVVNSLRGIHSTGLFGVDKSEHWKNEVSIVKSIGSPYMLFDWDKSDQFFTRMINAFGTVVGHGRWATKGDVTADNAHPFKEGHITLVHNGVINNFYSLKDHTKHSGIEVDSHLIAKMISEDGWEEVLPKVHGAYTFVWWDGNEKTLNLARNNERPLFIGKGKKNDTVYFASEAETILWNSMRNKVELYDVQEVPSFNVIKFKMGNGDPVEQLPFKEKFISPPATVQEYTQPEGSKSNVTSITPKIQKKNRASEFTDAEEHIFDKTEHTHSISRGKEIVFTLDDYKGLEKEGTALIYGSSGAYPNVEFCVVASINATDDLLMSATEIRGVVASIFLQTGEDTMLSLPWKVFVSHASCFRYDTAGKPVEKVALQPSALAGSEDTDGEVVEQRKDDGVIPSSEFITLDGVAGEKHSMAFHRILDISDSGCGWCDSPIRYEEINNRTKLNQMLIWEDVNARYRLICPDCSRSYRKNDYRQTRTAL